MDVIIIGAGAVGMKTASRLRRRNPEAEITVVESGKWISLSRCGLPYFLEGKVSSIDDLRKTPYGAVRDENFFSKLKKVKVLTETKALEIDRKRKTLKVSKNGGEDEINYDYLVIATGARAVRPKIPGIDSERVVGLYSPEDAKKILRFIEEGAKRAVVIGGGFIGLEACEALKMLGLEVTLIEALDRVAPTMLDPEMSRLVSAHLKEKGVKVLTSTKVEKIVENAALKVYAGKEVEADFAVAVTGIKPNSEIAVKAGLEVGKTGGIVVNERLQTNDEFIYAGGDCVETVNLLTGEKTVAPFGDVANKHGRVIADNILGGNARFRGVIGTAIIKVFDFSVGATGLTEERARNFFGVSSVLFSGFDRTHYYPGVGIVRIKLVFEEETKRILGAQVVGNGIVDKRIDVIATAIISKMTLEDLEQLDLAYAPPYSPAIDPVITTAYVAKNKLEGLFNAIKAEEVKQMLQKGEDFLILDVRTEAEAKNMRINLSNVINIPLTELRNRVKELPRDRLIVVVCPLGLRAYEASRILISEGFNKVRVLEGGFPFLLTL
jgi:NADPH-dependent 2,4-dienoyl-CoA reductase/sulfur reductase-like enzyme/rhodanese-related sulfurtransferase